MSSEEKDKVPGMTEKKTAGITENTPEPTFVRKETPEEQPEKYVDPELEAKRMRIAHKLSYPTGTDILAMIGFIVISAVIAVIVIGIMTFAGVDSGITMAVGYVVQILPAILFIKMFSRKRNAPGPGAKLSPGTMNPPLILWGLLLILVTSVVIEPLLELFPARYLDNLYDTMGRGGWTVLTTVVLAPILEEILFRGQILGSIRNKYGAVTALLISSLIFGAIHIIPQQVVNAFFIGLILGYIYIKTGSLLSVIIMHAVNNALAYLQLELSDGEAAMQTVRGMIANDTVYFIVYGICIALLAVGFTGIYRTLKRQRPDAVPGGMPEDEKIGTAENNTGI